MFHTTPGGVIRNNIHLISPGCPRPSVAFQVQNRGLKYHSFCFIPYTPEVERIYFSSYFILHCSFVLYSGEQKEKQWVLSSWCVYGRTLSPCGNDVDVAAPLLYEHLACNPNSLLPDHPQPLSLGESPCHKEENCAVNGG